MTGEPYIFGIGAGKTASHSLAAALAAMGFRTRHLGHDKFHNRLDVLDQINANIAARQPPTAGIRGVDAVIDWPIWSQFAAIDASVPEARFVLTYRPPDDCALSWCRMIAAQHERVGPGWPKGFIEYGDQVREHNDAVLRHFFGRPDKLLVLDVRDDDATKWRLLAKFLERPAPIDQPYPRAFDHKDWQ